MRTKLTDIPANISHCPWCDKPFLNMKLLTDHVEKAHPEQAEDFKED